MKKNTIVLLTILFFCAVATVLTTAQKREPDEVVPANEVNKAIQTFTQLVNASNIKSFGLENIAQLKSVKPGKQYKKYMIGLNDVKKYKAGENVENIIKELPSVEISLIDARGKILTSIEFDKSSGKWQASGFGSTPAMRSLKDVQLSDSASIGGRLIQVPALHTSFIAISSASGLNFIALQNNEYLNFRAGTMLPASEAILRLTTVANQYNGLPQ